MTAPVGEVSGKMAVRLVRLLAGRGADAETAASAVGLTVAALAAPGARFPYACIDDLVEATAERLGAAGLGLAIAQVHDEDTYDLAGFVLLASPTLRVGYERAFRYQRLWGDGERFTLHPFDGGAHVRFRASGKERLAHAILAECALAEILAAARFLSPSEVRPERVTFRHAPLGDVAALGAHFGAPVVFGAEHDEVTLHDALLDAPHPHGSALFHAMFERRAADAVARLAPEPTAFADRVRTTIGPELGGGTVSLATVARRLAVSSRTLQRRLKDEGTTFDTLVDEARQKLALTLLERQTLVKEVAFLVGFADERALRRALRRWRGPSGENAAPLVTATARASRRE